MFDFLKPRPLASLNHWIAQAENFEFAPSQFYDSVEKELRELKVPGLEMSRIDLAEGGILSDGRVYLRMMRERLVFDVCAAPFGKNFFFSCRMAEIPAIIKLWQVFTLFVLFFLTIPLSILVVARPFGVLAIFVGPMLSFGCLLFAAYIMRNAVAMGLKDVDAWLLKNTLLGDIYVTWFRRETYFRQDTRLMYLEIVSKTVRKLAEDVTAAKGVKLVDQYEQAPILGELYKPVLPRIEVDGSKVTIYGMGE